MASIDKAAIVFSIAIALVGVGIAVAGNAADNTSYTTPIKAVESIPSDVVSADPIDAVEPEQFGADIANKVKSEDSMMAEKAVQVEIEISTDEKESDVEIEISTDEEKSDVEIEISTDEKESDVEIEISVEVTHIVDIPAGTSVPGCEVDNACFEPADITVNVGDTVEWLNVDTAAHTVTSGNLADGVSDIFDSGLIIADASFLATFDDVGSYDYFCVVHPWMAGSVTVK